MVWLENSVELLLENLQSCLSKIGLSQCAIESYETGSFITGKDAGALNTGIKIFGDLHEKNKEAYDEIYETEQKIKDEAEKRKTQGIWRTVGGAVLIATGVACIVLTGGAAIPIVADVAVAVGSGTAVFGAADAIEGTQDIYYGSTGDIDSTAVNGIKDDLFQGNEDAYYLTENAFAFAASAMIPIGQASTAGNLTFKSTATIVAKEGISMGAGAGAQKITTDVTGNDTAGMVAGMVASGVTAKGLNGIEAEANKLAKAPKGIDGVTEGAGNLAEDVGKIVETSYGKSSLIELKNTDNFMDSTIEHIFEGNVRRGKAGGYHYECIKDTAGNIVNGTEVLINDLGVYKAQVEVNGIPKSGNGGYSTFFPKEMSPQDVIDSINEAYNNKVFVVGSKNSYIGISNNGLEIEMYINNNGKIISAFPKE